VLHHASLPVSDLGKSAQLYDAALAELGYRRVCGGMDFAGYGLEEGKDRFTIKQIHPAASAGSRFHLAFSAPSRDAVQRFHAAAIRNGAVDDGPPGPRRHSKAL
jgi:catechol 2,3-dioxygenase-like lactoylglutathione lyase family enzyme